MLVAPMVVPVALRLLITPLRTVVAGRIVAVPLTAGLVLAQLVALSIAAEMLQRGLALTAGTPQTLFAAIIVLAANAVITPRLADRLASTAYLALAIASIR